jgi:signal transduction histidine kinase
VSDSDPSLQVAVPSEGKGRIVSIFVGAVLLPSLALSYVSIQYLPELATNRKVLGKEQARKTLLYIEKDLAQTAQMRALEAARTLGTDRVLDGRLETIGPALREAGLDPGMFTSIHLEGASPRRRLRTVVERRGPQTPREALSAMEPMPEEPSTEDAVPWADPDGKVSGLLRYRFSCEFVHHRLVKQYFEKEFPGEFSDPNLVVRVSEQTGEVVYETGPTPTGQFEVSRGMESPSFRGMKLFLRYKDYAIEKDVRRWEMGTLAVIAFIDLMLAAGLYLVYSNVRREVHLARLKSDFVANVSHELKTPLALIRLFAETLELGRVPNVDKARQYYRVINKESQRLTQLINNILDFSRIEAGRKEYRFSPTNVGRVVSEVVDAYRFQVEQQGFTLDLEVEDEMPEVEADAEALGQAILNLLNNAIKYSRETKTVKVRARRDGGRVLVSVTDRGIGIPKMEHRKIFEKFYRGEDSLVHETKGSGLGLSLVRHIMEAHGGSIEVESAPGKGSTFTLAFPIRRPRGA